MPLTTGDRFGGYEVRGVLGRGGMGEVYQARDTRLGRDVALKILPEVFATDPDRLARFEREARTLASLNHPNIAQIYAIEEAPSTSSGQAGVRALVMELVTGEDLSEIIARGPITLSNAFAMARQIADALDAAHEAGIVHRDLKPANVKVRDDGTVKVLDFGLAKALAPAEGASAAADTMNSPTLTSPAMTQLGVILGTAAYMSPEQARGRTVDKRADIWAFGVVLFEMLTGRPMFAGETITDVIASVLTHNPDWTRLPASTPDPLRRLLARCLDKDPRRRLRDIGEARIALDEAQLSPASAERAAAPPSLVSATRTWALAVTVAVGASALSAFAVWRWMQVAPPPVQRFTIAAADGLPIAVEDNHPDIAISPDGSRIVYLPRTDGPPQLVVRAFDRFETTTIGGLGQAARGPFFSPDGQSVAFQMGPAANDPVLARVPIGGGAPVRMFSIDSNLRGASWVTDGTIVYATTRITTGLFRAHATSGAEPEQLTTPVVADGELDHLWPRMLPDGKHVLFTIQRAGGVDGWDIALLSLDTRKWRVLVKGGSVAWYMPTGHIVFGGDGGLRAVGFDLQRLEVSTAPIQVLDGVVTKQSGVADFSVATNGTIVYLPGGVQQQDITFVWRGRTGAPVPVEVPARAYRGASISPDGRYVAVTLVDDKAVSGVFVLDLARDSMSRLTPQAVSASDPVWSPDGRSVAYFVRRRNDVPGGVFRISASGATAPERLTEAAPDAMQFPESWPSDTEMLLTQTDQSAGVPVIQRLTIGAAPAVAPLLPRGKGGGGPKVSPDGKWLAYISNESGQREVYVRPYPNVNDDRIPVSSGGGRVAFWTADGRELFYSDGEGSVHLVTIDRSRGFSVSKPVRLFGREAGELVAVGRDGRLLFAMRQSSAASTLGECRVVLNWFSELERVMRTAR